MFCDFRDIISINQDPMGIQGVRVKTINNIEVIMIIIQFEWGITASIYSVADLD